MSKGQNPKKNEDNKPRTEGIKKEGENVTQEKKTMKTKK